MEFCLSTVNSPYFFSKNCRNVLGLSRKFSLHKNFALCVVSILESYCRNLAENRIVATFVFHSAKELPDDPVEENQQNQETSLVFVDANVGDEDLSIEVVNSNHEEPEEEINSDTKSEREDIIQAKKLPTRTVRGLFYNDQEHLDLHKNIVKSKPSLDEKVQEAIATLSEIIQNPRYEVLHPVGLEVRDLLSGAITYAHENSTSLKAAIEMLEKSLVIYKAACESAADKFELSDESTNALVEYKRKEKERLEMLIKRKNLADAEVKREEGIQLIEQSIEAAKVDTGRVIARQMKEEQEQVLLKLTEEKQEIEKQVDINLSELHMMSDNCESDILNIDKSLETLTQSAEAALSDYTKKENELCARLQENRSEQEELRKRLAALMEQENALEDERSEKKATQERAEQTEQRARDELENWKRQIEELHRCCQAALSVLWQFKEGSFKLINSSIDNKTQEEKRLQEQDILAHRALRDALVAASVDCKEVIKSSDESLTVIKERLDKYKKEINDAARKGVRFLVEELEAEKKRAKENYNQNKHKRAESEMKLEQYTKDIEAADVRLKTLGEALESMDAIYNRYQQEVDAAWQQNDDNDGGSLNSLDSM